MTSIHNKQTWDRWSGWRRLSVPASPWSSAAASDQAYVGLLVVLSIVHLLLAGLLPPAEDELYYWAWSQNLQWSYFDHPPMVAWLIRVSTTILGDNLVGIRFFAVLGSTATLYVLGRLCGGKGVLTLLLFTPLFFLGALLMTPDAPLLLFWTLYLAWTVKTNRAYSSWSLDPVSRVYQSSPAGPLRWVGGGCLLGLGLLSKYTMFLAVPCALLLYGTRYRWRAWLGGFTLHLAVAALIAVPIWIFNREHAFAPLLFQWRHAAGGADPQFWSFIGAQILILGALPLLMLPWMLARVRYLCQEPKLQACFWFSVPPLLFFLFKAMGARLEANWSLVAYIGTWPLAQRLLDGSSFKALNRWFVGAAFAVPLAITAAMLFHFVSPLPWLAPDRDRLLRLKSQYELSAQIAEDVRQLEEAARAPLFAPTYQWTSYLRYRGLAADQLHPEGRASQFTLTPAAVCDRSAALVLEPGGRRSDAVKCFGGRKVLKEYALVVRGREVDHVLLVRYSRGADGISYRRPAKRTERFARSRRSSHAAPRRATASIHVAERPAR